MLSHARDRFAKIIMNAGAAPVAMKSAAMLAEDRYEDSGERFASDIDLFVHPSELHVSLEALRDAGCVQLRNPYYVESRERPAAYDPIDLDDFRNDPSWSFYHVPAIRFPDYPVHLELHIGVGRTRTPLERWLNAAMTRDLRPIEGMHLFVPPLSVRLLQNMHHSQIKDRFGRYGRLDWRHLIDAEHLLRGDDAHAVVQDMQEVARVTSTTEELELHLWQLQRWLGVESGLELEQTSTLGRRRIERFLKVRNDPKLMARLYRVDRWRIRARNLAWPPQLRRYYGPVPYWKALARSTQFRAVGGRRWLQGKTTARARRSEPAD